MKCTCGSITFWVEESHKSEPFEIGRLKRYTCAICPKQYIAHRNDGSWVLVSLEDGVKFIKEYNDKKPLPHGRW